jgi:hypothetical protein
MLQPIKVLKFADATKLPSIVASQQDIIYLQMELKKLVWLVKGLADANR